MHELTFATEMVRTLQGILQKEGASEVVSISVEIGAMSGIEREPFAFCFPIAAEGTPVENARLIIDETPLSVRCTACKKDSKPEFPTVTCVECGSSEVEIVSGRDFVIKSMEVR